MDSNDLFSVEIKSLSIEELFKHVYESFGYHSSPENNSNKSLGIYEKLGKVLFLINLDMFCSNVKYLYNIEKKELIILKVKGKRRIYKIPSYEEKGIFNFFSYRYQDDEKDWYYITYNIDTYNYNCIKFDLPVHNNNIYYEKFIFIVEEEDFETKRICLYKINDKKLVKIFQKDVVECEYNVVGKKICVIKKENETFSIFYYDFENNITIENNYNMNFLYEHLDKNLPIHLKNGNLKVQFIFGTQVLIRIIRLYKDGDYFFINVQSDDYFLIDLNNNYIRNLKYIYFVRNPDLYFNFRDNFIEYKYDDKQDYLSRFIKKENPAYIWSDRTNCLLKTYDLRRKIFYTMCCFLSKNNKLPYLGISLKLLILYYIVYCL